MPTLVNSLHRLTERSSGVPILVASSSLPGMPRTSVIAFDVDTSEHMAMISSDISEKDRIMTAMVPAEDCVWVGMATGHILVFNDEELLTWFHPYTEYVCFLTVLPCSGPCEMEKCMVASGGKGFQSMIEDFDQTVAAKVDEKGNVQKDDSPNGKERLSSCLGGIHF